MRRLTGDRARYRGRPTSRARCRQRLTPSPTLAFMMVLLAALVVAACGGDDGDGKGAKGDGDAKRDAKTSSTPASEHPDDDPDATQGSLDNPADVTVGDDPVGEDPAHPANQTDPNAHPVPGDGSGITVVKPVPFTTVVGKVQIRAKVPCGTSANAQWAVTRGDEKALAHGRFNSLVQMDDVCTVLTTANLAKIPEGSYELHVSLFAKAKMTSDTLVPISIHAKSDPNDVPANAPPPG